jgi:homogentisate 1,2-dioxygenase
MFGGADWSTDMKLDPNPMRWDATPLLRPGERVNFIQGVHTLLGSGDATCKSGIGIYVYAFNINMSGSASDGEDLHMYNSDGGEI